MKPSPVHAAWRFAPDEISSINRRHFLSEPNTDALSLLLGALNPDMGCSTGKNSLSKCSRILASFEC
ncbi:MAG: hypothetical protein QF537_01675 [SAR324 cluster bacterium]|nr:hypothetical protein [SAR324 cluster bacterium]MDP6638984.1 hypothetical protein [SAR324 cluster bacterium]